MRAREKEGKKKTFSFNVRRQNVIRVVKEKKINLQSLFAVIGFV